MKWPAFEYARPTSLDAFFALRAGAGGDAKVLAGGQSLLASLAFRLSEPSLLIDITAIEALSGVRESAGGIEIGALTRHAMLERDPLIRRHAPLLRHAAPLIAHPAIRNRGTIGGSLALADPASELPACAVALKADIIAASASGERRIAADDFFAGMFETALGEDEIIRAVHIPGPAAGARFAIREITRRSGDYAMAGLAAAATVEGGRLGSVRLVYFSLGDRPILAEAASAALAGSDGTGAALDAALAALDEALGPSDDLNGPAAMKMHLARVLTRRVVGDLITGVAA